MVKRPRREYLDHHQKNLNQDIKPRVRKNKDNITFKLMFFYGFVIFIIGLFVIIYINQYVEVSRLNFQLEKLEDKRNKIKSENAHLELKISRLKTLDRVEEIAKSNLEMIKPNKVHYITLNSEDRNIDNLTVVAEETKETKKVKLKDRVLAWFSHLSEVQAGTLDE